MEVRPYCVVNRPFFIFWLSLALVSKYSFLIPTFVKAVLSNHRVFIDYLLLFVSCHFFILLKFSQSFFFLAFFFNSLEFKQQSCFFLIVLVIICVCLVCVFILIPIFFLPKAINWGKTYCLRLFLAAVFALCVAI